MRVPRSTMSAGTCYRIIPQYVLVLLRAPDLMGAQSTYD